MVPVILLYSRLDPRGIPRSWVCYWTRQVAVSICTNACSLIFRILGISSSYSSVCTYILCKETVALMFFRDTIDLYGTLTILERTINLIRSMVPDLFIFFALVWFSVENRANDPISILPGKNPPFQGSKEDPLVICTNLVNFRTSLIEISSLRVVILWYALWNIKITGTYMVHILIQLLAPIRTTFPIVSKETIRLSFGHKFWSEVWFIRCKHQIEELNL